MSLHWWSVSPTLRETLPSLVVVSLPAFWVWAEHLCCTPELHAPRLEKVAVLLRHLSLKLLGFLASRRCCVWCGCSLLGAGIQS